MLHGTIPSLSEYPSTRIEERKRKVVAKVGSVNTRRHGKRRMYYRKTLTLNALAGTPGGT